MPEPHDTEMQVYIHTVHVYIMFVCLIHAFLMCEVSKYVYMTLYEKVLLVGRLAVCVCV